MVFYIKVVKRHGTYFFFEIYKEMFSDVDKWKNVTALNYLTAPLRLVYWESTIGDTHGTFFQPKLEYAFQVWDICI